MPKLIRIRSSRKPAKVSILLRCFYLSRPDITDLYAFMRYLDDLIDEDELCIEEKRYVVDQFCLLVPEDALRKPYELNKDIMSKFNALQKKYGFGNEILMLFVEGLYWDLENKEYNSQQDLVQYCIRVAGTVGLFLCYIMGRTDEYTLYYACCLGKLKSDLNLT